MWARLFSFLLGQLTAGLVGYLIFFETHTLLGSLVGVILGSLVWVLLDLWRAARFQSWVKSELQGAAFPTHGWWGELTGRIRRQLLQRDRSLLESEQRLQGFLAALQASPNGVLLLDGPGQIEWFNQTAAAHFGLATERDLKQHLVNLVRDPIFSAYIANQGDAGEVTIAGRESTPVRPVTLSVQLHPYGMGRRLLLSRDVTALQQAEVMRRDFVANVTHEIRTPLTVLSGFIETLQSLPLKEAERERYLGLMAEQSLRMQTLVNDLLILSRIEGMALPGLSEWVSLPGLMQQLEQEARALSATLGGGSAAGPLGLSGVAHRLEFSNAPDIELAASSQDLFSAMSNLVSNAIRYTPPGELVRVSARLLGDGRFEFSVRDTGPGIAAEHLPRLTERFYRVDRSRSRETGGTGLGLAIVKHVLQRHGAELNISSTLGQGSVFAMIFPINRLRSSKVGG